MPVTGEVVVDYRPTASSSWIYVEVAWRGGAVGRRVLDTQTLVVGRQWRVIAVITLTERDSDRRRRGSGPPSKSRQAETRLCLAHSPGAGLTSGDGQLLVMDGGRAWHHVTQQRLSVTDHAAATTPPVLLISSSLMPASTSLNLLPRCIIYSTQTRLSVERLASISVRQCSAVIMCLFQPVTDSKMSCVVGLP